MRNEHEHLMNDATGLPQRLEVKVSPEQWWVIGARSNHAVSLFAGEDFVLQFNPEGELRRAFAGGIRVKAEDGKLWHAVRATQRGSMKLDSKCFTQQEHTEFIARATSALTLLNNALMLANAKSHESVDCTQMPLGRVIADDPKLFLQQMTTWANQQIAGDFRIANQPHAAG